MTNLTIIAVDDDVVNLEIIVKNLKDAGYTAVGYESSIEAWEYMQNNPEEFDIAILDKMMPDLDGIEFLKNIRAHEKLQDIPVIMQTADTRVGKYGEALEDGVNFYLTKPYEPEDLSKLIKAAIRTVKENRKRQSFAARIRMD